MPVSPSRSNSRTRFAAAVCARVLAPLALLNLALLAAAPAQAELRGHGGFVKSIAVTPDGSRAVSASFDYSIILWNLASQEVIEVLDDHEGAVNAVVLLGQGRKALSASDDGTLRLWNLDDGGSLLHVFTGHTGKVAGVAVTPDGRLAASAGWDGTVRLWDIEARKQLFVLDEHRANVNAVAFSHDGRHLLTGSYDSTIRCFELPADGSEPRLADLMEGHDFGVNSLAFLPGDRQAISASVDETVRLWDLESGTELAALRGHEGPVFAVAVSPDGQWAASAGVDGTINLWTIAERRIVASFYGHSQPVWALAFTPDGKRLLSAGGDEVTRLWDLESRSEIGASDAVPDAAVPSAAEEDSRGAELFRKCAACHTVTADGGNRAGPTLYGVFGRRAGSIEGYNYSDALEHSDLVWTEETIDRLFDLGPDAFTPGSKMPLQRMPSAEDREDLIAYLKGITAAKGTAR